MNKNKYWKWVIFIYFLVWFAGDLAKGVIWADLGENYEMCYLYWFTSKPVDWIFCVDSELESVHSKSL